ncbi:MAG: transglutaminase domain-containing protein, partial [Lachnospiraceae bacterium]|nr:transglutaminase domain-containing protein [Lachnospiraceae bacterium]
MIKKKNILRVSVLCMALLFGGQAFAKDVSAEQVIEELTEELDSPDPDGGHYREAREQSSPRRARMRMKASSTRGWYGSQLASGNEQAFYDALLEKSGQLSEMTAAYAAYKQKTGSVDGTFVSITLSDPVTCVWAERYQNADYLELYMAFNRATHAFIKDYPEYFWLGSFTIGFHAAKNSDGTHTLKGIKLSPAEYYEGLMTDDFGITAEALQAAIAAVGSQDTAYDTVKAAHDYTVNLINYGNAGQGYGHVITGALLQKYEHTAVCEAYAKLFCLLCRENGINCITINGGAKRDSNGNIVADHMWNYVQIDGFWYLVDATWDDTLTTKAYFLAGAESAAYSSTKTVSDNHMPVGIFSTDDSQAEYAAFSVPAWSELSYEERNTVLTPEKDRLTLKVGETGDLSSVDSTFHESTTRVTCSYESSDKKVVTVDSKGKVTAAGVGTAEITITSSVLSKVKTTVSVTVEAAVPETEPATEPV